MSTTTKGTTVYLELDDGSTYEARLTFQSRLALERVMASRKWTRDTHAFSITGFLAWHAVKHSGQDIAAGDKFEDVVPRIVEADLNQPNDDEEDDELEPTPTQPADGYESP